MASMSACFFSSTPKPRSFALTHKPFKPSEFLYFTPLPLTRATEFRCARTSGFVIRASSSNSAGFDATAVSGIKPGSAVESDKLPSDVRKRAMDAIDSSGRRVTVGDVASKAGLKLNEAQRALQALAADTDGFLEVSDEGDVLYGFPKDYRSKLTAKSLKIKFEPLVEKGKMAAEYVVRVSFGTALIASIVIVYTTIIAIASSSRYISQSMHLHCLVCENNCLLSCLCNHCDLFSNSSFCFSRVWTVNQMTVVGEEDLMGVESISFSVRLIYFGNISN